MLLEIVLCLPGPALAGFALWGMGYDLHHSWCGNCAREIFIFAAGMCACAVICSLGSALEKTLRPVSRLIAWIALVWVALVIWLLFDGVERPFVQALFHRGG